MLGLAWLGTTLSIINGGQGVPWSALAGLVVLVALVGEYFAWPAAQASGQGLARPKPAALPALGPIV
jgi:hypothetical protein